MNAKFYVGLSFGPETKTGILCTFEFPWPEGVRPIEDEMILIGSLWVQVSGASLEIEVNREKCASWSINCTTFFSREYYSNPRKEGYLEKYKQEMDAWVDTARNEGWTVEEKPLCEIF